MVNKTKGGRIKSLKSNDEEMALINEFALEPLESSQVFTFSVTMCDNEIDRAFERFSVTALNDLSKLFGGKTMLKDHKHLTDNQCARIYATSVEDCEGITSDGLPRKALVAKCYMLAIDANADTIAEIKAGIKKEVSVGFACKSATCSICGANNCKTYCSHWNGKEYDGETCYFTLDDISDAYELSFVAVPCQRDAGIKKDYQVEAAVKPPDEPEQEPETEEKSDEGADTRLRFAKAYLSLL